jgi:hypothetical protein
MARQPNSINQRFNTASQRRGGRPVRTRDVPRPQPPRVRVRPTGSLRNGITGGKASITWRF